MDWLIPLSAALDACEMLLAAIFVTVSGTWGVFSEKLELSISPNASDRRR